MHRAVLVSIGLGVWVIGAGRGVVGAEADRVQYIENETVRLGVNLSAGGSIFYFSLRAVERNLINHHDRGRFVQQSYYGDADGSLWNKQPWRWNPVQGGDWKGTPAEVLGSRIEKETLYVKTRPRHWASGASIDDAMMEMTVRLGQRSARIHYVFVYDGTHSHAKRSQELPAVFVDYGLKNLVFYRGNSPWTKGPVTRVVPGWPNEGHRVDESWAAYVDETDWGLGVFTQGMRQITSYRYRGDEKTGPTADACSYFAPVEQMKIVPGFRFAYDVHMTIGKLREMRTFFYALHRKGTE